MRSGFSQVIDAVLAIETSLFPVLCRPLWVDFPTDTRTYNMEDEYLIGICDCGFG